MKIKYLGTAACEGVPAIFCDCATCRRARRAGGKNIRTRSQAIIDDALLMDFPADTYIHSIQYGIELSKIHTCLITHNHADHLYAAEIVNRQKAFAHTEEEALNFYGTNPACKMLWEQLQREQMEDQGRIGIRSIQYFQPFDAEGYHIIPLKANHDLRCDPAIFLIQKEGKSMLYAHDTGVFPEETWRYLEEHPVKLDLISLDCTHGINEKKRDGHMGLEADKEVCKRLTELNCADETSIIVVNHFSHNGAATYDELVPFAAKEKFVVSYDGLCVEF